MKNLNNNQITFIICLTTIIALCDNIPLIVFKIVMEAVIMAGLWVIIIAKDYIKEKKEKQMANKPGIHYGGEAKNKCKDCKKRKVGCHDTCKSYKAYRKEIDKK